MDKIRRQIEDCDSISSVMMFHSLAGGTGSGLGSKIIESMNDAYSDIL
jgi:tubulin gamma